MTKEMLSAARTGQPIKKMPMAMNVAADAQSNGGIVRIKINSFVEALTQKIGKLVEFLSPGWVFPTLCSGSVWT
jgi:hypothetical protein